MADGVRTRNDSIFLTIGTFSMFLLFYMIASRLIPLIPVWEVQEGQMVHTLRKVVCVKG